MREKLIQTVLIIVVIIFVIVLAYSKWTDAMESRYNEGVKAGKAEVVHDYEEKAALLRNNLRIDKGRIEQDAQIEIAAAKADADRSQRTSGELYATIDQIRSDAGRAGDFDASGKTAREAVNLLADLLKQSIGRSNTYAAFADSAYQAGKTCERQYDTLRKRIDEAKSDDKRADSSSSQIDTSSTRIRDVP